MITPMEMINTATIILGFALLFLLYLRVREANYEVQLKKHRSKDAGFADLLNYAAVVDDGVIVGKNGSFMAAWLYKGNDNANATEKERERVSLRINQAFSGLGNGWMLHVDCVRKPSQKYPSREKSYFPDEISAAIDEERRQLFESLGVMYEGFFVITITYFPPLLVEKKFLELMFDDDTKETRKTSQTKGLINDFKRECTTIESRLSIAVELKRLKGNVSVSEEGKKVTKDDFLRWLQFCCTGINHPVQLPSNPMYTDMLIGGQEMWSGTVPKIGRKYVQVISIEGFPLDSVPGILRKLGEQACEYRWSHRFIFLDTHEAISELDKFRKKWKQKVRGFADQILNTNNGPIDQDAADMVADSVGAIADTNGGLIAQGYYTSVVVLMDENRNKIEKSARYIEKAINQIGFTARIESINTVDAFFGSLPGHGVENVRRPILNTMNLADFLPTSTLWLGSDTAPCPMYPPHSPALMHCIAQGNTPFRLNLHIGDLGHALILGRTRSGKSTLLAALAAQFLRYKGMTIYGFDKGMSLYPITKAVNGKHFVVGGDSSKLAFCPLQFLDTKEDRAWAMEFIDTILGLNGVESTPHQRVEIGNAIFNMYDSNSNLNTMSQFCMTIQNEEIREALKHYTIDGLMGHLLDAEEDSLEFSKFTTFEIGELMELGDKYALPVLLYLFRRIERKLDGSPSAIFIDEAWIMLAHIVFRNKIKEWLRGIAKKNCIVILATQNLSDAANSGILDTIVESTATKIFLPNVYAKDEDTSVLYRRMGLNKAQIDIVASAVPKRHYYGVSEHGSRLYELALGPLALSFAGATDLDSISDIQALEAKLGDEWKKEWLRSRGVSLGDFTPKAKEYGNQRTRTKSLASA